MKLHGLGNMLISLNRFVVLNIEVCYWVNQWMDVIPVFHTATKSM